MHDTRRVDRRESPGHAHREPCRRRCGQRTARGHQLVEGGSGDVLGGQPGRIGVGVTVEHAGRAGARHPAGGRELRGGSRVKAVASPVRESSLSATGSGSASRTARARKTRPMPPCPSTASIRYGPIRAGSLAPAAPKRIAAYSALATASAARHPAAVSCPTPAVKQQRAALRQGRVPGRIARRPEMVLSVAARPRGVAVLDERSGISQRTFARRELRISPSASAVRDVAGAVRHRGLVRSQQIGRTAVLPCLFAGA